MDEFDKIKDDKTTNVEIPEPEPLPIYSPDPQERRNQIIDRLRLKNKILQYQEKFREELVAYQYKMNMLEDMTTEDLDIFLDEIRIAVRQRNSANMTKTFYFGSVDFIEKASCSFGYDIKGLHAALYAQKEIHKCLDELSLEYEDNIQMPAHIRLPFITLQTVLSLYQVRKIENVIDAELKREVKKEIVDMYKDL